MKRMIIAIMAMLTITVSATAMSYDQARREALFLTDKMAYELNLTNEQYDAAYEINLDYLMGVTGRDDVFGTYWILTSATFCSTGSGELSGRPHISTVRYTGTAATGGSASTPAIPGEITSTSVAPRYTYHTEEDTVGAATADAATTTDASTTFTAATGITACETSGTKAISTKTTDTESSVRRT